MNLEVLLVEKSGYCIIFETKSASDHGSDGDGYINVHSDGDGNLCSTLTFGGILKVLSPMDKGTEFELFRSEHRDFDSMSTLTFNLYDSLFWWLYDA